MLNSRILWLTLLAFALSVAPFSVPLGTAASPAASALPVQPVLGDTEPTAPAQEPEPPVLAQSGISIVINPMTPRLRGGQELIYIVSYSNNSGATLSNARIKITWNFWSVTRPTTLNADRIQQYCSGTGVNACVAYEVTGPAITRSGTVDYNSTTAVGGFTYTIGDGNLANGASGSFKISLIVPENVYPLVGKDPRRPSASAEFFVGSETTARAIYNTSALVEGPLFDLRKERTAAGVTSRIFPTETGEYRLRLTNVGREDSIDATNVRLTDIVPFGAEFVSSVRVEGTNRIPFSPAQTTVGGRVVLVWTFDRLNRGATVELLVTFRKLDITPCDQMSNRKVDYYVTSDEVPLILNSTERYKIEPQTNDVVYNVQGPVQVSFSPAQTVIFGERGSFTFSVRNFWPQPITGLQVRIELQPNVRYVPGTASNVGSFAVQPPSGDNGGVLIWTVNMPAGSMNTPVVQNFSFEVTGRHSTYGNGPTGAGTTVGSVIVPPGMPANCNIRSVGGFKVVPRLQVRKYSDATGSGGNYIARNDQPFQYIISLTNNGSRQMNGISVYDLLPAGNDANFTYITGSATIDNGDPATATPLEPSVGSTQVGSLVRTTLIWSDITLAPGETLYLRYNVLTRGRLQTVNYCNDLDRDQMMNALINPDTNQPGEEITFTSARACVRLTPNIQVSKFFSDAAGANLGTTQIITGPVPAGGQPLYFTLTITNNESVAYNAGLVDFAPAELIFQAVESSNLPSGQQQPSISGTTWTWPRITVNPGQSYTVRIRTLFNPPCSNRKYNNRVGYSFIDPTTTQAVQVSPQPAIGVEIDYRCSGTQFTYEIKVDRTTLSLRDRGLFTLTIQNTSANTVLTGVAAYAILPPRYLYSETNPSQSYIYAGQRELSDGRTEVRWNVASIPANGKVEVTFRAAASDIIGTSDVYAYATADNQFTPVCRLGCITYLLDGQAYNVASVRVTTQPLHTYTPRISGASSCATSGEERIYTLTLLNTNTIAYRNTTVTLTLPIGLQYLRPDTGMPAPQSVIPVTSGSQAGATQLVWRNLTVPAKPSSGSNVSELPLAVVLQVGQVWSDQGTIAEVTSPDGIIPITDGEVNPTVRMCVDGPAVAKTASITTVSSTNPGDPNPTFLYQIEVVNPTASAFTISLRDVLPAGLTYNAMLSGSAPAISSAGGRTVLQWNNLNVPAQSGTTPGRVTLLFRVTVNPGQVTGSLNNTVEILSSSTPITNQLLEAPVLLSLPRMWVPYITR